MNMNVYKKTRYQNIYKHTKNGTYAVDISLGYNQYGKRVRTTRTGLLSVENAKKILTDTKIKENIKTKVVNKLDFKSVWEKYIYECESVLKLEYNTIKKKKYAYNNYISKFFDNYNINDITKHHIVKFHEYLDKTNLSDRTKNDIHRILAAVFNWACKEEIVLKNPVSKVKNFTYETKEKQIWTLEQYNKFINTLKQDKENKFKAILTATITTLFFLGGFRLEELLSIKKGKINKNGICIDKAVVYVNGVGYVEKSTKTNSSERIVDFDETMINLVLNYIKFYENEFDVTLDDNDYIFLNPKTKKLYSDNTIRKLINKYSQECGNPHISPHCLRHSHTTLLHDTGYDIIDISKRLGHSSSKITEKVYCHLSNDKRKNIAENMGNIVKSENFWEFF